MFELALTVIQSWEKDIVITRQLLLSHVFTVSEYESNKIPFEML